MRLVFKSGLLKSNIYEMTLTEFEEAFVNNSSRERIFKGLLLLIEHLREIGCITIYIDGSYVTKKQRPNDVDVCWVVEKGSMGMAEEKFPWLADPENNIKYLNANYCADVFPSDFLMYSGGTILDFFQKDKETHKLKGIIKMNIL